MSVASKATVAYTLASLFTKGLSLPKASQIIATLPGYMDKNPKHTVNGDVVKTSSIVVCAVAINRAWWLLSQIDSLRKSAKKTAQCIFYSQYNIRVGDFLNQVEKEKIHDKSVSK